MPDSLQDRYRSALGKPKKALLTPSLLLDLDVVKRNIAFVAGHLTDHAALRPQVKSHKCAEIARLQLAGGGISGFTTATLWEALALHNAGLDDFLIANQIVGPEKCRLLAQKPDSSTTGNGGNFDFGTPMWVRRRGIGDEGEAL